MSKANEIPKRKRSYSASEDSTESFEDTPKIKKNCLDANTADETPLAASTTAKKLVHKCKNKKKRVLLMQTQRNEKRTVNNANREITEPGQEVPRLQQQINVEEALQKLRYKRLKKRTMRRLQELQLELQRTRRRIEDLLSKVNERERELEEEEELLELEAGRPGAYCLKLTKPSNEERHI